MFPFDYTAFAVSKKVGIALTGLTPPVWWLSLLQDGPKSVRNRCVIKVLVAFLCCYVALWTFLWADVGDFVMRLGQISSFFFLPIKITVTDRN